MGGLHHEDETGMPTDNEGWFKRLVISRLDDLAERQKSMMEEQRLMHETNANKIQSIAEANAKHIVDDATAFHQINTRLVSLDLSKQVIFAFVGMVLAVVAGGIIAKVFGK